METVNLLVNLSYLIVALTLVMIAAHKTFADDSQGDNQKAIMDSLRHRESFLLNKTESKWGKE